MKQILLLLLCIFIFNNTQACHFFKRHTTCGDFTAEELIDLMIDTDDTNTEKAKKILKVCKREEKKYLQWEEHGYCDKHYTYTTVYPAEYYYNRTNTLTKAVIKNRQDIIPLIANNFFNEAKDKTNSGYDSVLALAKMEKTHPDPIGMATLLFGNNFARYFHIGKFCQNNKNNLICTAFQQLAQEHKLSQEKAKELAVQQRRNCMIMQLKKIE